MAVSLLVALVMLVGKLWAYRITGSDAIFSDALESVIHLFATGFAAFSLWYTVRPADAGHPYGHGKMAYFSSGFEGALILLAALAILSSSVRALLDGPELQQLGMGLLITGGLGVVNLALGGTLIHIGRRHNSLVLVSNGQHVLADMWTSVGVVLGVGLVWWTGLEWLDPVVAILVALHILWTGMRLLRRAVQGLMEAVDKRDTAAIQKTLAAARADGAIAGFHQLRHRRVAEARWIEYHLQFEGDLSLTEAHARSHEVEEAVAALFPEDTVYVTAHLEPDDHTHPEGFMEPQDPLQHRG